VEMVDFISGNSWRICAWFAAQDMGHTLGSDGFCVHTGGGIWSRHSTPGNGYRVGLEHGAIEEWL